jgi:uncharacterized RDD family membrane protein YckC
VAHSAPASVLEDFRERDFVRPGAPVLELDAEAAAMPRREYHPFAEKALQRIDRAKTAVAENSILDIIAESGRQSEPLEPTIVRKRKRVQQKGDRPERIEISLNQGMLPFEFETGIGSGYSAEEQVRVGLWSAPLSPRIRAGAIDAIFVFGCFLIFLLIVFFVPEFAFLSRSSMLGMGMVLILILLSYIGLFTTLSGGTLGTDHEQLEIVAFQGTPITPKDAGIRAFGCLVSLGCFGLGFLWAVFDPDRLTWHDKISKTLVVEKRPTARSLTTSSNA